MTRPIAITRVATRNFIVDLWMDFLNLFGRRLTGFELMLNNAHAEIFKEIKQKNIKLVWYRIQVSQVTTKSVAVFLYGEAEDVSQNN